MWVYAIHFPSRSLPNDARNPPLNGSHMISRDGKRNRILWIRLKCCLQSSLQSAESQQTEWINKARVRPQANGKLTVSSSPVVVYLCDILGCDIIWVDLHSNGKIHTHSPFVPMALCNANSSLFFHVSRISRKIN